MIISKEFPCGHIASIDPVRDDWCGVCDAIALSEETEKEASARFDAAKEFVERDPGKAAVILNAISELLWPSGQHTRDWSPDTFDEIAYAVQLSGLQPEGC